MPIDKFSDKNTIRYYEFQETFKSLNNHTKINWLDKKHIVNMEAIAKKVRQNPITGCSPYLVVSGNFHEAFNIFAIISANPLKKKPMQNYITKDNGTSATFLLFIQMLILSGWFQHDEVLVMDNAAIHTSNETSVVEDLLWEAVVDGRPLRNIIIYLPTRAPELNPIEYIFNVLAARIRSWRYRNATGQGVDMSGVIAIARDVMDNMEYDVILRCAIHCGY